MPAKRLSEPLKVTASEIASHGVLKESEMVSQRSSRLTRISGLQVFAKRLILRVNGELNDWFTKPTGED